MGISFQCDQVITILNNNFCMVNASHILVAFQKNAIFFNYKRVLRRWILKCYYKFIILSISVNVKGACCLCILYIERLCTHLYSIDRNTLSKKIFIKCYKFSSRLYLPLCFNQFLCPSILMYKR